MSSLNTHLGADALNRIMSGAKTVYFVGIGGVSMASLALMTARNGYRVSGSDRTPPAPTSKLGAAFAAAGITVYAGHDPENIPADCSLVVYTVAVGADNPELVGAGERGITRVSRADYMGWLMTAYRVRIGVSGMHGKSTTTSMLTSIFMTADADPTVLIGADYAPIGGAYRVGGRDSFIFEACEYMDSFLDFAPTVAVLLNADFEHVDYFTSMDMIRSSFASFASLTGPDGVTVYNADDPNVTSAARAAFAAGRTGRLIPFGIDAPDATVTAQNLRETDGTCAFTLRVCDLPGVPVTMSVPGRHAVSDALAAAAAAYAYGIPVEAVARGIEAFTGTDRRMSLRGKVNGADVYDDYGHHPTEISATLGGARSLCRRNGENARLVCVFQPHTYSRLKGLYADFVRALSEADRVVTVDVYSARETDTLGVSSQGLARDVGDKGFYAPSFEAAAAYLRDILRPGDVCLIMGAGDVTKVTKELLGK